MNGAVGIGIGMPEQSILFATPGEYFREFDK